VSKRRKVGSVRKRQPSAILKRDSLTFTIGIALLAITTTVVLFNPPIKINFYKNTELVRAAYSKSDINRDFSSLNNVNFEENYDYTVNPQILGTVRVPVLMYHRISPLTNFPTRRLYVSPETFERQMAYLQSKNYKTLTPLEFYKLLEGGKNPIQKSILLTFDDGNFDNYKNAFPVLKKYHMTGTFYVVSSRLSISPSQLREMSDAGMEIESHTENHLDLQRETNLFTLRREILGSKNVIESITGKPVYSLAYPGCVASNTAINITANSGYLMVFSCGKSIDHALSHRYSLDRIHVFDNMENFKKILSGIWEVPAEYK
jgi:peptidoglycan/xylan/chitin deacetylase (PgdA/CDA1 family)